jgi:uncharacterized protein YggE
MRSSIAFLTAAVIVSLIANRGVARAADNATPPPTITVSAAGSVDFTPDIARFSVSVRGESANAADAARSVNGTAQSVIAALIKSGVAQADIQTSGYNIYYQMPPPNAAGTTMTPANPDQTMTQSTERRPIPPAGTYVCIESVSIKTTIVNAGAALEAAIDAGANGSQGMEFDTSNRESLYRQALARAVATARAEAAVIAKSAGVSIVGVESISTGLTYAPLRVLSTPQVMPGSSSIQATVTISYRIK